MSNKILRDYVSEVDQFLEKFDQEHPKPSPSQKKEIDKYRRIYQLRDEEDKSVESKELWERF